MIAPHNKNKTKTETKQNSQQMKGEYTPLNTHTRQAHAQTYATYKTENEVHCKDEINSIDTGEEEERGERKSKQRSKRN
jgi:hypothetical protein